MVLAARHRIKALELRSLGGTVDLPAYFAAHWAGPEALAAHVTRTGCRVAAIDTSFRLIGNEGKDREQLVAFLPWAEGLGGVNLRVFDGGTPGDAAGEAKAVDTLTWWNELRRREGWSSDLMIETHDALVTAEAIQSLNTALGDASPPRILWDAHHTWKKGGEDPLVTWAAIAPQVVHLHVKDSVSRPSSRHPFTYVLPGAGEFPMEPLRARLVRDGYAGVLSLEWELLWHPYLPPLDDALAMADRAGWW